MRSISTLSLPLFLALSLSFSGVVVAQDASFEVPQTEYGYPDLQGVWNFSSSTPMQRPAQFGEQEFLTQEQIQAAVDFAEKSEFPKAEEALEDIFV